MNCKTCDREFIDDGDQQGFCGDCLAEQVAHAEREAELDALHDALVARDALIIARDAAYAALERAVEPCGICTEPWADHDGAERYCPYSKEDRILNGETRYCAKSTWEVTLVADKLERENRELERQRDALLASLEKIEHCAEQDFPLLPKRVDVMNETERAIADIVSQAVGGLQYIGQEARAAIAAVRGGATMTDTAPQEPPCSICAMPLGKHYTIHADHYEKERAGDGASSWYRVCPTTMVLLKQLMRTGHHYRTETEAPL